MLTVKKYLIISDIHGNYSALSRIFNSIEHYNKDNLEIICLGDIVGYNPEPEKCVKTIKNNCNKVIAGNHDKAVIGELRTDWFRSDVKKSIEWTKNNLSEDSLNYLKSLKTRLEFSIDDKNIIIAHGSPNPNSPFSYIFNKYDINNIEQYILNTNILFIGHTHIPYCFCNNGDGWIKVEKEKILINPNYYYIINVGSVGQPRDRDSRASYVLYDEKENTISFYRIEYNIEEVQKKFKNTGLPEEFAFRLKDGR